MTIKEFEKLVDKAVEDLPKEFKDRLNNVDFVVEVWPNRAHLQAVKLQRGLLFGLYQGTPQTKRGRGTLYPDKITIFAGPILYVSRNQQDAEKNIARVVRHEIAHHFGLSEHRIRRAGH